MSPGLDEEPQRLFLVTAKAPANWYGGVDLRSRKKVKLPCLEPHMRVVLVCSDDLTGLTQRKLCTAMEIVSTSAEFSNL